MASHGAGFQVNTGVRHHYYFIWVAMSGSLKSEGPRDWHEEVPCCFERGVDGRSLPVHPRIQTISAPRPFLLVFVYVAPHFGWAGAIHGGPRPQFLVRHLPSPATWLFPKI